MSNLAGFDTDYLRQCLEAWRALDPIDATARAIEAELRERGESVDDQAREHVEGICEANACQHLSPDELRLRLYARHGRASV